MSVQAGQQALGSWTIFLHEDGIDGQTTVEQDSAPPAPPVAAAPAPPVPVTPAPPIPVTPAPPIPVTPAPPVVATPAPPVAATPAPPVAATPAPPVAATPAPPVAVTPAPPVAVTPAPPVAATPTPPVVVTPAPPAEVTALPSTPPFPPTPPSVREDLNPESPHPPNSAKLDIAAPKKAQAVRVDPNPRDSLLETARTFHAMANLAYSILRPKPAVGDGSPPASLASSTASGLSMDSSSVDSPSSAKMLLAHQAAVAKRLGGVLRCPVIRARAGGRPERKTRFSSASSARVQRVERRGASRFRRRPRIGG